MTSPRQHDERILCWLRLRREGVSVKDIALMVGGLPGNIASATMKVRLADEAESGEDCSQDYWPMHPSAGVSRNKTPAPTPPRDP